MRGLLMGACATLLLAVGASGCGGGADRPDDAGAGACGDGPGTVEVGRGGSRLVDLPAEGGELPIVLGSQGGIHVLVGFRARDMELDMSVEYRLVDPATGAAVGSPTRVELRPTLFSREGADAVRNPDLVILDNAEPRVDDFAGRAVRLELEAVSAGSHACDHRDVTLTPPE